MDSNSNPQDAQDMQEALEAYQAYKAHKANAAAAHSAHAPSEYAFAKGLPPDDNALPNVVGDPVDRLKSTAKMGIGAGIAMLAPPVEGAGIVNALSRAATNAGGAGLQKYLGNLIDQKQDPTEGVGTSAAIGAFPSLALDSVSGLGGYLKGAANRSMLRAVGLTGAKSKNIPSDLGNRMVDEGIWGTKSQMADKVAQKYSQAESQIQDLAQGLEGSVSGDELAKAIEEKSKQYMNPEDASKVLSGREGGVDSFSKVSNAVRKGAAGYQEGSPEVTSVRNMVGEGGDLTPISTHTTPAIPETQGTYGGKGLLALKRSGDAEAFNQSGQMGNTYAADAYRAQADEARNSLATLSDGEMPEALKREQTLLYANKGLMQPTMVQKNPVNLTDIGSSVVGAATHGLPGAGTAVLASKAAISPFVQSLFAKGAQASSNALSPVGELADPRVLQSLFGLSNANSSGQ